MSDEPGCPNAAVFARAAEDVLAPAEAAAFEAHLDGCANCRAALDRQAGCAEMAAALSAGEPPPSLHLALAMTRLRDEGSATEIAAPQPRQLGGFEIVRTLGRGGMGVVYEGYDPVLRRAVAIKTLAPHLAGDPQAKERFLREARAAAAVTHEHVVPIHAVGEADGLPYLVQQLVVGESLAERLQRGPLPFAEWQRLGIELARGLAAAHAQGLVHRDVKPANVLLEAATGSARLADFGLAKALGGTALSGVGTLAGTPAFMAPEQAAGAAVDARADLFSLGVLLYNAASGSLPFAGDSPHVVLQKIRFDPPAPLAAPELPGWARAVIDRLLEKDPAHRVQRAADAALYLERRAELPPRSAPGDGWSRRWYVAAACAAALAGGLAAWRDARRPSPRPPAEPPSAMVVGLPERFATFADALAVAPNGGTVELRGDGPHLLRHTALRGKAVTIRAAAGFRPVVMPAEPDLPGEQQWLDTDADLALTGLDIRWTVPRPAPPNERALDCVVVASSGARLKVADCAIEFARDACAIGLRQGEGNIERCWLHAADGAGAAVVWEAAAERTLRIAGSSLCAGNAVFVAFDTSPAAAEASCVLELDRNAVQAGGDWGFAIGFWHQQPPPLKCRIAARGNLIRCKHVMGIPFRAGPPGRLAAALRALADFDHAKPGNVYQRGADFLAGVQLLPFRTVPSNLGAIDRWLATIARDSGSIVAELRFRPPVPHAPLVLESLTEPSGPVPADAGPPPAGGSGE